MSSLLLKDLPDELVFKVFTYLSIQELIKCGQVSKRIRAISYDGTLPQWQKFNFYQKKVPAEFLQLLLDMGCKYLSLSNSRILGCLNLNKSTRLEYLNLSVRPIYPFTQVKNLLEVCFCLQKLSLRKMDISQEMVNSICAQNGKTLKILDLSDCFFTKEKLELIIQFCLELRELNLSRTRLPEDSIAFLANNITTKIEKLDIYNMMSLKDEHIKKIVTRCTQITELNIGGRNRISTNSLAHIIQYLPSTLVKLQLNLSNFDLRLIRELKKMSNLKVLIYEDQKNLNRVIECLPHLSINSCLEHIAIAKPYKKKEIEEEEGFWEIKEKQTELSKNEGQVGPQKLKKQRVWITPNVVIS